MKIFLNSIKENLKNQSSLIAKILGIKLLDWKETKDILSNYLVKNEKEKQYTLPSVFDIVDKSKIIFPEKNITTPDTYVWMYHNGNEEKNILRNGSISIRKSVLDTDFGNTIVLKDAIKISVRNTRRTNLLIAPWTHYWSGYYDYIVFVIAKLVRFKEVNSQFDWNNALVAYPLMHTAFEKELLSLIDLKPEQLVDSRTTKVLFETCLLGNNSSWFYPNSSDITLLKKTFHEKLTIKETNDKRIYICRAGRRQINDEHLLIEMLRKYDFTIIEDKARTIAEQAEIYHNASVIIGPHGASFANILWCKPGTHLIELFPVNYMPEYFRYLAYILDLQYSAYCFHPILSHGMVDHTYVNDNIEVKVDDIDRYLSSLLLAN